MKKLVQISAILSLVFVFSVVAAHAQTGVKRFEAKVPFDFNIGSKSFEAGNYVLKISKTPTNVVKLTIEDENRNVLESILAAESGDVADGEPRLIFNLYDNQRFLTKISTLQHGVVLHMSRAERDVARKQRQNGSKNPTVAVKAEE